MKISELPGLGAKSAEMLAKIDIETEAALRSKGAVAAYRELVAVLETKPSLNLLYAMVGALNGESWLKIAQQKRFELLSQLEGLDELEQLAVEASVKKID